MGLDRGSAVPGQGCFSCSGLGCTLWPPASHREAFQPIAGSLLRVRALLLSDRFYSVALNGSSNL